MNQRTPAYAMTALLLAAVAAGAFASGSRSSRYSSRPSSSADSGDLVKNNMFLRKRGSASREAGAGEKPTPTPAQNTVLTGIVQQDSQYFAFLEDTRTNVTTKARVGDVVCGGRVTAITMDGVEFDTGSVKKRIEIGKNLEGTDKGAPGAATASTKPAAVTAPTDPAYSEDASPDESAASPVAASPAEIEATLAKLRQRRRMGQDAPKAATATPATPSLPADVILQQLQQKRLQEQKEVAK